jgi:hypothetical protein
MGFKKTCVINDMIGYCLPDDYILLLNHFLKVI